MSAGCYLKKLYSGLLVFSPFLLLCPKVYAQSGKDGAETISTAGVIFNRYDVLSASAAVNTTTISVSNIANLGASAISGTANDPYANNALSYGDLLMIIKMQGATINTSNNSSFGSITSYNNVGVYEVAMVQSVSGNTITLSAPLTNGFTINSSERVQVVRIPRLSSLTINSGASLTGQSWGGSYTGGIVAIDITGNVVVNGTVTANGIGFRGGAVDNNSDDNGVTSFASTTNYDGGEKGESIAGYQSDYDGLNGRYGRGAPANGGGGGNSHNAGGGGGANAGSTILWTGNGNPDLFNTAWSNAWNLETTGFSTSSSAGGGRGGYSFSKHNKDALSAAPGNSGWQGDGRKNIGGLGGRPLSYTSNTLFMGGGGGAGDADQSSGSAGANGGGIVFFSVTGNVSGTGSITANGNSAANSTNLHKDGLGGGGGGGAIKLNVQGSITGISLSATGGNGGSQLLTGDNEADGPGGGGGGGYVAVTGSPSITIATSNGVNGTTTSDGLTEFTPNGATKGGVGDSFSALSFVSVPDIILPVRLQCFETIDLQNEKVQVNWTVYDEVDILRYELEQKSGAGEWKTTATALSQTGSNVTKKYSIVISKPESNAQYRIKAVDRDGSLHYTCTRTLNGSTKKKISVKRMRGSLYVNHPDGTCSFILYNSFGQRLPTTINHTSPSTSNIETRNLSKGIYYLQIIAGQEKLIYDFVQ